MMRCADIRTEIAVGETAHPEVQAHLSDCTACQQYAHEQQRIDALLANTLNYEPPPELLNALHAIAHDHARPTRRVSRWYDHFMIAVIAMVALTTTVFVSAELIVYFAGPYGFGNYASDIVALPSTLLSWLTHTVPMLSTVVLTFDAIRAQLVVILLVVLGGLAYTTQRTRRNQL